MYDAISFVLPVTCLFVILECDVSSVHWVSRELRTTLGLSGNELRTFFEFTCKTLC